MPTVYKGLSEEPTDKLKDYFGSTEAQVRRNLVSVTFFPGTSKELTFSVHKCALQAFQEVADKVKDFDYNPNPFGGSFNWRQNANNPDTMSYHSFGIAVDFRPDANPNQPTLQTDMPRCWVNAWLTSGFEWGGNYWIDDTSGTKNRDPMHFEYVDWVNIPLDQWRQTCVLTP